MARHKHRKHHSSKGRTTKNMINKAVEQTVSITKSTSKKYMPKVKTGLENVGSKVVSSTQKSVPYLQRITRKFFGLFSGKTRKHRKH